MPYIDGLVQYRSISSALALEIMQSYSKPSTWLKPVVVPVSAWWWLHDSSGMTRSVHLGSLAISWKPLKPVKACRNLLQGKLWDMIKGALQPVIVA